MRNLSIQAWRTRLDLVPTMWNLTRRAGYCVSQPVQPRHQRLPSWSGLPAARSRHPPLNVLGADRELPLAGASNSFAARDTTYGGSWYADARASMSDTAPRAWLLHRYRATTRRLPLSELRATNEARQGERKWRRAPRDHRG